MKKIILSLGLALSLVGCFKPKTTSSVIVKNPGAKAGVPNLIKDAPRDPSKVKAKVHQADGRFAPIFFTFDESQLSHESMLTLDSIAVFLEENPRATILIAGHADERGTEEYNLALGQERAESVKRYLTLQRIDPARINTVSYGEEMPFAEGTEEADLALNRRAEFTVSQAAVAETATPKKGVELSKKVSIPRLVTLFGKAQ